MKKCFSILLFLIAMATSGQEKTEIIIDTQYDGYFKLSHKKGLRIILVERFDHDSVKITLLMKHPNVEKIIFDSVLTRTGYSVCATDEIKVPDIKNVESIIIEINQYPKIYIRVMPSKHYLCISKYGNDKDEITLLMGYQKYPPLFE